MRRALIFLLGLIILASPCFAAIDKIAVSEGALVKLKIDAYDLDDDNLTYYFPEPFDKDGQWQLDYDDEGTYNFTISVGDGKDIVYRQVEITVKDKDQPPVFVGLDDVYNIKENELFKLRLNATDPDGDEVEFVAVNIPENSSFSGNVFEWEPDYDAVSKQDTFLNKVLTKLKLYNHFRKKAAEFTVVFVAKGKEESVKKEVKIMVNDTNRAPVLDDLENITVDEGEKIVLSPSATDPDGDVLKYSYSGFMDSDVLKTDYDDAGEYKVNVTVSDGKKSVTKEAEIQVRNVNRIPELDKIKDKTVYENQTLMFELKAKDKDGDNITYSLKQGPYGANVSGGVFTYTPGFDVTDDEKTFLVTFAAADYENETRRTSKISVRNVNQKPVIESSSMDYMGDSVKFSAVAKDFDGDNLTYRWIFGIFDSYGGGSSHIRKFTTPGKKTIKLLVSDGKDTVVQKWSVNVAAPEQKVVEKPVETTEPIAQLQPKTYKTYTING